jgi:hypothetical protein
MLRWLGTIALKIALTVLRRNFRCPCYAMDVDVSTGVIQIVLVYHSILKGVV